MNLATPSVAPRFDLRDAILALTYGIAGVLILTVQPLVFGPLVGAGLMSEGTLGRVAASETAMLALASALLPGWLSKRHLRLKVCALTVVIILCNVASAHDPAGRFILPIRAICGFAEGGVLGGAFTVLFAGPNPERMNAIFLAVSNLFTAAMAYIIPTWLVPVLGLTSSFKMMAWVGGVALLASSLLQHKPQSMEMPGKNWDKWPAATFAVLLGIVLQNAAIMSAWTFLESTARYYHFGATALGLSAAMGVFAQVLGATSIATFGYRLPVGGILVCGSLLLAIAAFFLGHPVGALSFVLANVVMGFCWLALLPLSIKLICEIERTREAVYLTAAAQMAGLALGPLLASLLVRPNDVQPAYALALVLGCGAALLMFGAQRSPSRIKS